MYSKTNAQENISPSITHKSGWRLVEAIPLPGYKLKVKFVDGLEGIVELNSLIMSDHAGVFAQLRDKNLFETVYLNYGVASWCDENKQEIDLAPDTMHDEIQKNGKWVVN